MIRSPSALRRERLFSTSNSINSIQFYLFLFIQVDREVGEKSSTRTVRSPPSDRRLRLEGKPIFEPRHWPSHLRSSQPLAVSSALRESRRSRRVRSRSATDREGGTAAFRSSLRAVLHVRRRRNNHLAVSPPPHPGRASSLFSTRHSCRPCPGKTARFNRVPDCRARALSSRRKRLQERASTSTSRTTHEFVTPRPC